MLDIMTILLFGWFFTRCSFIFKIHFQERMLNFNRNYWRHVGKFLVVFGISKIDRVISIVVLLIDFQSIVVNTLGLAWLERNKMYKKMIIDSVLSVLTALRNRLKQLRNNSGLCASAQCIPWLVIVRWNRSQSGMFKQSCI